MDEKLKIEASMAFFRAHGTQVDGAYGNVASRDGLALYQNAATSKIPKQTGPGIPDNGRRIVGYAYEYNTASGHLNLWNANTVSGKPNREIGLARIQDDTAELYDAFPRKIAITTREADGTYSTEQLWSPPKRAAPKEQTMTTAQMLNSAARENASMQRAAQTVVAAQSIEGRAVETADLDHSG